jgi:hypothetical protein
MVKGELHRLDLIDYRAHRALSIVEGLGPKFGVHVTNGVCKNNGPRINTDVHGFAELFIPLRLASRIFAVAWSTRS